MYLYFDLSPCLPTVASSPPQKTTTGTAAKPSPTPAPSMMSMCCVGSYVSIGCIGCVHVHVHTCIVYLTFPSACLPTVASSAPQKITTGTHYRRTGTHYHRRALLAQKTTTGTADEPTPGMINMCCVGTCVPINPRRACAARVTVLVLCVCVCVCHAGLICGLVLVDV